MHSSKAVWRHQYLPLLLVLVTVVGGILAFCVCSYHKVTTAANPDYETVLARVGYPAASFFPQSIPESAEDVSCSYPSLGGPPLSLQYRVHEDTLSVLRKTLQSQARWIGTPYDNDSEETGIFSTFDSFQDDKGHLPSDLTLYLMHSRPSKPKDWNHGEVAFAALSESRQQVLFHYDNW